MKKVLMWGGGAVLLALVAIQLVPVERTNPPVEADLIAPHDVKQILRASCYDCHSYETRWPWYSYVAPVSWLIADDVRHGRKELVFSEWELMGDRERAHVLEEIWEEVAEGEMPLGKYVRMHPEAGLAAEQLEILRRWTHGEYSVDVDGEVR